MNNLIEINTIPKTQTSNNLLASGMYLYMSASLQLNCTYSDYTSCCYIFSCTSHKIVQLMSSEVQCSWVFDVVSISSYILLINSRECKRTTITSKTLYNTHLNYYQATAWRLS
jgi:hypothetical protein